MVYADYKYYRDTYAGTMPEEDFKRLSRQASAYIDHVTFGRAAVNKSDAVKIKISDACCAVADELLAAEKGEVLSANNDGYAETYASSGKSTDQKKLDAATLYLGLTGLMYRGM